MNNFNKKKCIICKKNKYTNKFYYHKKLKYFCNVCSNCSKDKNRPRLRQRNKLRSFIRNGKLVKFCMSCKKIKNSAQFHKNCNQTDKLSSWCKSCNNRRSFHYRKKKESKIKYKIWKKKYLKNPLNRKKLKYYQNKYQKTLKYKKWRNEYIKKKLKKDIWFKLVNNLRPRIRYALKKTIKKKTTLKLLGCSAKKFQIYIKKTFKKGMNWSNYGKNKNQWCLDHIVPCRAFDLSKKKEQLKCFHYTNLQAMWNSDNNHKSDKLSNGISARKQYP